MKKTADFQNRKQLLKVAKLGPKAFEQCAGFLRIHGGENPLDCTSVHPESYGAARQTSRKDSDYTEADMAADGNLQRNFARKIQRLQKDWQNELDIGEIDAAMTF